MNYKWWWSYKSFIITTDIFQLLSKLNWIYTHTLTGSCVYASHCGGYNRSSFLFDPVDVIGSVNKPIHQTQFIWNEANVTLQAWSYTAIKSIQTVVGVFQFWNMNSRIKKRQQCINSIMPVQLLAKLRFISEFVCALWFTGSLTGSSILSHGLTLGQWSNGHDRIRAVLHLEMHQFHPKSITIRISQEHSLYCDIFSPVTAYAKGSLKGTVHSKIIILP